MQPANRKFIAAQVEQRVPLADQRIRQPRLGEVGVDRIKQRLQAAQRLLSNRPAGKQTPQVVPVVWSSQVERAGAPLDRVVEEVHCQVGRRIERVSKMEIT